uniref:Uncharacterized protein n=1 Tax=Chromera velia CCMP2878 TaxID=1169474 RepID=A0A0G4FUQ9_9ALVE|eukprot:Cvel_18860.t1-p1 / transcript=Cvel_18860.t1 / gene=Cvel_18860 / organism=Chromera_velia_CCMP2878 / gene_product=hypothetical protein / transcript_product=hypothetical protein / location=Cvel_scaffold1586:41859-42164(+) / protein_length=102 / sequence_SO=supercontig / SO=protein_coding / is_pseudo=false
MEVWQVEWGGSVEDLASKEGRFAGEQRGEVCWQEERKGVNRILWAKRGVCRGSHEQIRVEALLRIWSAEWGGLQRILRAEWVRLHRIWWQSGGVWTGSGRQC